MGLFGSSNASWVNLLNAAKGEMAQAAYGGTPRTVYNSNPDFTLNPQPQQGNGPFGAVPGALGLPNPYGDLKKVFSALPDANKELGGAILSKLRGELSPQTIANIQDQAARFGVASGMPGSGLAMNRNLRDLGLATEAQIQSGINAYNQSIPTISGTQTVSPALQAQIAETNAINAAAPNPAQAQGYAQGLFAQYLRKMSRPSGGTGGYSMGGGGGWNSNPFGTIGTPSAGTAASTVPYAERGFPNPTSQGYTLPQSVWDIPRGAAQVAGVAGNLLGGYF